MSATDPVTKRKIPRHPDGGRPTWDIAYLFPSQGNWTEDEYLNLENQYGGHIRVELYDGKLEVLPVPTQTHQLIILFLLKALETFTSAHAPGIVLFSGIRIKLPSKKEKPQFREPDVVYMKEENAARRHEEFWEGADLVVEVVSGNAGDRRRDLVVKPKEYAAAGISEYWIIDPDNKVIRVLALNGTTYEVHGEFHPGEQATGALLEGFTVSVDALLAGGAGGAKASS
ncbi:MAG TPA: Uma2 family endonuclease [Gemmataceae bacterium]|jgi:Uma2 family endonuclease|nr:Uma2 family endonuclease [Gemmataceae bacterium]